MYEAPHPPSLELAQSSERPTAESVYVRLTSYASHEPALALLEPRLLLELARQLPAGERLALHSERLPRSWSDESLTASQTDFLKLVYDAKPESRAAVRTLQPMQVNEAPHDAQLLHALSNPPPALMDDRGFDTAVVSEVAHAPPAQLHISDPVWIERPSKRCLSRLYPRKAFNAGAMEQSSGWTATLQAAAFSIANSASGCLRQTIAGASAIRRSGIRIFPNRAGNG